MANPTGKGGFRDHPEYGELYGIGRRPEDRFCFTPELAKAASQKGNQRRREAAKARALAVARAAVKETKHRDLEGALHTLYAYAFNIGYQAGLRWKKRELKQESAA